MYLRGGWQFSVSSTKVGQKIRLRAYKVLVRKRTKVVIVSGTSSPSDCHLCSALKETFGSLKLQ
jgi:hypothetical protein